jgi:hypothetical protein
MDSLAKSNLAHSIPPPLVGLVKVSPFYRFGMIVAQSLPHVWGGMLWLYDCSVYDCSPLHIGGYPLPAFGGLYTIPYHRGVFLFCI